MSQAIIHHFVRPENTSISFPSSRRAASPSAYQDPTDSETEFSQWEDDSTDFAMPTDEQLKAAFDQMAATKVTCCQCINALHWHTLTDGPSLDRPHIVCEYEPVKGGHRKNCLRCFSKRRLCDPVAGLRHGCLEELEDILVWSAVLVEQLDAFNDDDSSDNESSDNESSDDESNDGGSPNFLSEQNKLDLSKQAGFLAKGFYKAEAQHWAVHGIPINKQAENKANGTQEKYNALVAERLARLPKRPEHDLRLVWGDKGFDTWYAAKNAFIKWHLDLLRPMDSQHSLMGIFFCRLLDHIIWNPEAMGHGNTYSDRVEHATWKPRQPALTFL